eukprot:4442277-Prorocentrum_lima.AAC.1
MLYATALREAKKEKEARGVVTGIAASAPVAASLSSLEPEPRSQELATWKKIRFMDLTMAFPGIVEEPVTNKQKAYGQWKRAVAKFWTT